MKKTVILMFDVDAYNLNELTEKTDDELYAIAKEDVKFGCCDIEVVEEFCSDINNGVDCLSNYFVFPVYLDEREYEKWLK